MFNFAPVIPSRSDLDWCWYLRRHGQTGDMFERALHDIGVMEPAGWAHWGRSLLTQTGAPVEVVFTSGEAGFALTTEVGDPSQDRTHRLKAVCRLIKVLAGSSIDQAALDVVCAAQSGGHLQYGARLGLAAKRSGFACKLFAELPEGGADVAQLLYKKTALAGRMDGRPSMLAVDGATGTMTLSFKGGDTDISPLGNVIGISGDVFEQFGLETQLSVINVSIDRAGDIVALGQQFRAVDLFGTDLEAGHYLREHDDFDNTAYRDLADHLPPTTARAMAHNSISLTAMRGEQPRMQVSVAAPWGCMVDDM